jgi:hypothetical protein
MGMLMNVGDLSGIQSIQGFYSWRLQDLEIPQTAGLYISNCPLLYDLYGLGNVQVWPTAGGTCNPTGGHPCPTTEIPLHISLMDSSTGLYNLCSTVTCLQKSKVFHECTWASFGLGANIKSEMGLRAISDCHSIDSISINTCPVTSIGEMKVSTVRNAITIDSNPLLADLNGLSNVTGTLPGGLTLKWNTNTHLQHINGLQGVASVSYLTIDHNAKLSNLDGLAGLQGSISGAIKIDQPEGGVVSLQALGNITSWGSIDITLSDGQSCSNKSCLLQNGWIEGCLPGQYSTGIYPLQFASSKLRVTVVSMTLSTTLSTTRDEQNNGHDTEATYGASRCNDGLTDTFCSSSNTADPWLVADLGTPKQISSITIIHRHDGFQDRLGYHEFHLSNSTNGPFLRCFNGTAPPETHDQPPLINLCVGAARYVKLVLPGNSRTINLGEMWVYGPFVRSATKHNCTPCPQGTFSPNFFATTCTVCPTNQYQDLSGQTHCKVCDDIDLPYVGNNSASCRAACPKGSFVNSTSGCEICLVSFVNSTNLVTP